MHCRRPILRSSPLLHYRLLRVPSLSQVAQCYAASYYFSLSGRLVLCSLVLLRVTSPSQTVQCYAVSCYFSLSGRPVLCSLVLLLPFRPPSVMQSRVTSPSEAACLVLLPLRPSSVMESRVTSCYFSLSGRPTNNHQSVCDTPCHRNQ